MHDEQLSWDLDGDEVIEKTQDDWEFLKHMTCYAESAEDSALLDDISTHINEHVSPVVCEHKVIFRSCKKGFVTYCNKCGKILSVRNRREK